MEAKKKVRKTFYGSATDNTCAFCAFHHYSMTPRQVRQRGCLQKHCTALVRCEHDFWAMRDKRKEQRKTRKLHYEQLYLSVTEKRDGV